MTTRKDVKPVPLPARLVLVGVGATFGLQPVLLCMALLHSSPQVKGVCQGANSFS